MSLINYSYPAFPAHFLDQCSMFSFLYNTAYLYHTFLITSVDFLALIACRRWLF